MDLARYCERHGGLAAWCGAGTAPWVDTLTAPWSGTGAALRIGAGTAWWDNTYPASWSGRVQWCEKARARRCGVVQVWCLERTRRCAMEWRGFGAVGCARCDVIGKCGGAVEAVFRVRCQNGQIAKSFQNFIGKTHLKKIFLDGAGTAKYFIKLCLFAKQPVATKEEMTRGSV